MEFIDYIKKRVDLPEGYLKNIDATFDRKEYSKGHVLYTQNSNSKNVFFIEKGFGRVFYLKDGKDITHFFIVENGISAPIESLFYNQPSHCGMELIENSIVRSANYFELEKLISESAVTWKAIQMILIDVLKTFSDRLYTIQFQTAQERYNTMLENYPDIFLHAPLGHIASYLGITQETLSRIRSGK
jgi:CRP-like cAMP-binding protein